MSDKYAEVVSLIKSLFPGEDPVPLHAPQFKGNEAAYLKRCLETSYVSYVGEFVSRFEKMICDYTGSSNAVAMVNGTAALDLALICSGSEEGCEVLMPALSFVATANSVRHVGAEPVFLDIEEDSLGLSPRVLKEYLDQNCRKESDGTCRNRGSGKRISACVPVHVFGHPVRIEEICSICEEWGIPVIEDAAESLGSCCNGKHTGTFGLCGILSFNGNKIITTGGGGMVITDDAALAERIRHLSTTAKKPHRYEYIHDDVGYNYRMPNVNAAIGCAQMELIGQYVAAKRKLAENYNDLLDLEAASFFREREETRSNYWLNSIIFSDRKDRDAFLEYSNDKGVQTRAAWKLLSSLTMYQDSPRSDLSTSKYISERIVNIPSSPRL